MENTTDNAERLAATDGSGSPASCAWWVTCSPHEWVWTHDEQVAMAREVVRLSGVVTDMTKLLRLYGWQEDESLQMFLHRQNVQDQATASKRP